MDRGLERNLHQELERTLGVSLPPLGSHEFHQTLLRLSQVKPEALAAFTQVFSGSFATAMPEKGEVFAPPQKDMTFDRSQTPISSPEAMGKKQPVSNLEEGSMPPSPTDKETKAEKDMGGKKNISPLRGSPKHAVEKRLRSKEKASEFLNRLFRYIEPHWRVPVPHPRKVLMALLLVGSPLAIYWVFQEPINNLLGSTPPTREEGVPPSPPPPPQEGEQGEGPPPPPPAEIPKEEGEEVRNSPPSEPNQGGEGATEGGGSPNTPPPEASAPSPPQAQGQVPPPPLPVYGEELPPPPQGNQGGGPSPVPSTPVVLGRPSSQPGAPLVARASSENKEGGAPVGVSSKKGEEARVLRGGSIPQGGSAPREGDRGTASGSSPTVSGSVLVRKTPGEEKFGALKETFKAETSTIRKDGEKPVEEAPSNGNPPPSSSATLPVLPSTSPTSPSTPSIPSVPSPSAPSTSLPLPQNLRDLVGGVPVLGTSGGAPTPPGASPALPRGNQDQAQVAPSQPSLGQTLPFRYGQTLRGELLTGIVFAEGGSSESPILISIKENGQEYIFFGAASLNTRTNRVIARFDRIYKDGVAYVISGYMVDNRGTIGIYARVSEEAPNAAVNLVRGAFGGLKQYVEYYTKATQTTIIPGSGVVSSSAPPPLGLTILSSALGQFAASPDQVSILRVWSIDAKTPVGVIIAPPQ